MKDDLNKNENGRLPQFVLRIKDDLNFLTPTADHSTGNLTKNILAQLKNSTLIG